LQLLIQVTALLRGEAPDHHGGPTGKLSIAKFLDKRLHKLILDWGWGELGSVVG